MRLIVIVCVSLFACRPQATSPPRPSELAAIGVEVLRYAPERPAQIYQGMGISLHPLDPKHMDSLRELNMRFVRVGAGPGWGGMAEPDFPDDPARMGEFIAAQFNRDDPERLADFKESFAFFKQHDIRVVLVQYQIPYRWLKKDFMRTLKSDRVDRIVAQWTALLKFFRAEGMGVDFVELANEPDGNWDGHIPPALYYRLVPRARRAFDRAEFSLL